VGTAQWLAKQLLHRLHQVLLMRPVMQKAPQQHGVLQVAQQDPAVASSMA
jgi:hypothetical protein